MPTARASSNMTNAPANGNPRLNRPRRSRRLTRRVASDLDLWASRHFESFSNLSPVQAVVRHVKPGFGLGLKFSTMGAEDRPVPCSLADDSHFVSTARAL
jgi:hypothetical protein